MIGVIRRPDFYDIEEVVVTYHTSHSKWVAMPALLQNVSDPVRSLA